ncbi:uncharacterized protein LOC127279724 [Leptopilina boulardi]|uniref:uncharacterized protein LOC127279724 n=1 Tax=Leptopilina boulardi TaxID=63433 RepID=UPI0021F52902|nr:uncharacterized protein LOC127279724 [Leptopilina boulardi]XP_051158207.1 uncharacterized protein LOC127279724 [Leptopilina boulardi]
MTSSDYEHYRQQQEKFVSNHMGTTPREVIFVLLPNICSILLTTSILALFKQKLSSNIRIIIEFSLTIVPCILCCTVLSEYLIHVCASMLIFSLIFIFIIVKKSTPLMGNFVVSQSKRLTFVTNFRALVNIVTVVCILAVDFKVFPRKFAKTEIYGYSLMDTGVGLFIIANALVAPEARNKIIDKKLILPEMLKSIKSCIPLLVLGFARFISIEYLGYQKHITEYGVHWNFFITLAFVKLFISIIPKTITRKYSLSSGIWLLIMYEYGLSGKNLKKWILSEGSRIDFISANREGLVSLPGYIGLYLIAVSIGSVIHSSYQNLRTNSKKSQEQSVLEIKLLRHNITVAYNQSMILCIKLCLIASHAFGVTLICDKYFSVSRRLTNSGYCAWILTLSTTLLTLLLLVDIVIDIFIRHETNQTSSDIKIKTKAQKLKEQISTQSVSETFEIFEAVNYNGLAFFLVANLLTGTINMSIKTLNTNNTSALNILIVYMAISISFAVVCYRLKFQIKL